MIKKIKYKTCLSKRASGSLTVLSPLISKKEHYEN